MTNVLTDFSEIKQFNHMFVFIRHQ